MQIALGLEDWERFMAYHGEIDRTPSAPGDQLTQARIRLLMGQYYSMHDNWNLAARDVEVAERVFQRLGATYWEEQSNELLQEIMDKAPSTFRRTSRLRKSKP
jgi:hypothetical protein